MQAMYEFCLRTWTATGFLVVYDVFLLAGHYVQVLQIPTRETGVVTGLLGVAIAFVFAFGRMASIYAQTWVFHTKMDFYLDQTMGDRE